MQICIYYRNKDRDKRKPNVQICFFFPNEGKYCNFKSEEKEGGNRKYYKLIKCCLSNSKKNDTNKTDTVITKH